MMAAPNPKRADQHSCLCEAWLRHAAEKQKSVINGGRLKGSGVNCG